jgi:hypothetical protein
MPHSQTLLIQRFARSRSGNPRLLYEEAKQLLHVA